MKFTKLLFLSLILSLPLGQFGRLPFGSAGINIYLHDVICVTLVFYWLIYNLAVKKSLRIPRFYFPVVIFVSIALISLVSGKRWVNWSEWLIGSFYLIRWIIYSVVALISLELNRHYKKSLNTVRYLLIGGLVLSVIGFFQLIFIPDFSTLDPGLGWDPHQNRLASSFFDPNFTGAFLVTCISLALSDFFKNKKSFSRSIVISILLVSLLLTFSRSAWLMLAVVIAVIGVLRSRLLLILSLLVAFSAYFFVPRVQTRLTGTTDPADSAHFRIISWKNTLDIAKDHPWLGVGYNTFRYAQERYGFFDNPDHPLGGRAGAGSDSSLLLVLATTGIFGLLSYLLIYIEIVRYSISKYIKKHDVLSFGLLAIIFALIIESQFINSLFFPQIMLFLWILIGLVYSDRSVASSRLRRSAKS